MTIKRYQRNLERIDLKIDSELDEFCEALDLQDFERALICYRTVKIWREMRSDIQAEMDALTLAKK